MHVHWSSSNTRALIQQCTCTDLAVYIRALIHQFIAPIKQCACVLILSSNTLSIALIQTWFLIANVWKFINSSTSWRLVWSKWRNVMSRLLPSATILRLQKLIQTDNMTCPYVWTASYNTGLPCTCTLSRIVFLFISATMPYYAIKKNVNIKTANIIWESATTLASEDAASACDDATFRNRSCLDDEVRRPGCKHAPT